MENQRILFLAATAFLVYLLWQAWAADYGMKPAVVPSPSTELQNTPPASSELPVVSTPVETQPQAAVQPTGQTILVKTDVLWLDISLQGGDIIGARLPKYAASLRSNTPYRLLGNTEDLEYIAQSGLLSASGPDLPSGERMIFSAAKAEYSLKQGQKELIIPLTWKSQQGVLVTKTFTLTPGSYKIGIKYTVENGSSVPWAGKFYAQLKTKFSTETPSILSGAASYTGAAYSTPEAPYEKAPFTEMEQSPLKLSVDKGWVSLIQHYFVSSFIPSGPSLFYSNALGDNRYRIGFSTENVDLMPGGKAKMGTTLFLGPKVQELLKETAPKLDLTVDYGWLWFIAQPLFWLLNWFHKLVGNWGFAIILITICVKVAFFHLSTTSYRSMANMRRVQPQMVALKERFGDDRSKLSQAMMELYRKEKINPLGGCLPILVQIPVFIALYWVLLGSVELRHAPFIFWIHDLSEKDPYYVLPLLMGATMFFQQLLNPAPIDPMQARIMKLMPILFTFFFLFFPAGLVLYWFVSNLLSIAQQWAITRMIAK